MQIDPKSAPAAATIDQVVLVAYRQVLTCSFLATLFVIAILIVVYLVAKTITVLPFVAAAGVLGAFFSSLMRLYDFDDLPKALLGDGLDLHNMYLIIYAFVPPLVGAMAATALYLAFASGLITGDLFPDFDCQIDTCKSFADFTNHFGPSGAQEYAKALIWGFASGFSERLVPNLLQSFAQKVEKT